MLLFAFPTLGQPDRPNIVVILADDLGYGDLSIYGASLVDTPNIDRLAHEGIRLTDAHAPNAVCAPTRYSILTGSYFMRAQHIWDGRLLLHDSEITLPGVLKSSGYDTAAIGKWHLGFGHEGVPDWNEELKPGPLEVGFDYYFGTPNSHNEPPWVFVENHFVVDLEKQDPIRMVSREQAKQRKIKHYGWGASEGAERAHAARPEDQIDLMLTDKAVDFIQHSRSNPFFLYLAFQAPHVPLTPSKEFKGGSNAGVYGDFIEQLDFAVGRVLQALEAKGLKENTLVVLTSDNGGYFHSVLKNSEHRPNGELLGQKTDSWEGGHRVPFIARWPGQIPENTESDHLFALTDLMATLSSAAGVAVPEGAAPDSLNQIQVLKNPFDAAVVRNELLIEGTECFSLRQGKWLFIPAKGSCGFTTHQNENLRWGPWSRYGFENSQFDDLGALRDNAHEVQLYKLDTDPTQKTNVAGDVPDQAVALKSRLGEILSECYERKWYSCEH